MPAKSPFLIIRDLISPLQCEDIVHRLKNTSPNSDQLGNPTVTYKGSRLSEMRITTIFNTLLPTIEEYYTFTTKTLSPFIFEWYPSGCTGQKATCEGSILLNKRGESMLWQKVKDYDFSVVVFLNDFSEEQNFDERFEVRGGKLEFPTHDFGFNANRGTTVIYPCRPQFVNAIGPVEAGDLNIIRFNIIATTEYHYDQDNFPGGYMEWFADTE